MSSDRQIVYWRTKYGCRFGYLISEGPKWSQVEVHGKTRKWPSAEIAAWPPPPPGPPVKRKRVGR